MNRLLRAAPLALLALLVVLSTGCSHSNTYFDQRGRDLADIFRFNVSGGGPGIILNARATELFKFGGGYCGFTRGEYPGLGTRRLGWIDRRGGYWKSDSIEYGFGPFYHEEFTQEPVWGNVAWSGGEGQRGEKYRTIDEIGFTVHLAIFGLDFAVRPLEVFDFLVGIFTLDPLEDDHTYEDPENFPQPLESFEKGGESQTE